VEHLNKHKRILGILFICFAALKLLLFIVGIQLVEIGLQFLQDEAEIQLAAHLLKYVVGTIILLYSIPTLLAGIGLLNGKKWALILALILGIISLPFFPIGTGLGVYAIIVFLMDQSSVYNTESKKENEVKAI